METTTKRRPRSDKPTVMENDVRRALGDHESLGALLDIHSVRLQDTLAVFYLILRRAGIDPSGAIVVGALDALASFHRVEGRIEEQQHLHALAVAFDCLEESERRT